MKNFIKIEEIKNLNIKVILDDNQVIYEGRSEDAPIEIKKIKYSKIEHKELLILYVYS